MTVSTIATIASGLARVSNDQTASKPASVLKSLVVSAPQAEASHSADLSAAITLQNQIAQFRVTAQSVAQASTLLDAANTGATEISRELGKLKDLAAKAANVPLSSTERAQIDAEFQAIRSRIDSIANSTKFQDEPLLNGSSSQLKVANDNATTKNLAIGSLTDSALFKGANPNLVSPANAKLAEAAVKEAQRYTDQQIETIEALKGGVDYAASTVESAIQNQDAARSTLSEADLLQLFSGNAATPPKVDMANSQVAQTNQLPNSILQLISE